MAIKLSSALSKVKVKSGARSYRSLQNAEHINYVIQRETARADRNGHEFSMVLFRVRTGGRHALSTVRLARTILARARATDEIGWFDDQFLCAVLPDTLASGAWHFAEDVCAIIAERAPRPIYAVYSYPSKWFDGGDGRNDGGSKTPDSPPARRGNDLRPADAVPTYADGDQTQQARSTVHPMEHLLARPLPIWKRCIDILGASFIILMASPLMLLAALLIKLGSKGPVMFIQQRAGLGGKPFRIYKFRTMCIDAEAKKQELRKFSEQDGPAFKMKRDPRVTRVGAILRKTSIDELPQLFNVIKGDMTLVGPRPLPINEADGCERWQRRRLDVTPGLTCIWQVRGRSTVSFAEWVRMDVAYIRHRTLFQDIRILLQTVPAVLLRKGAS